jgi:DNA-binding beta-propeller fold protein YncE
MKKILSLSLLFFSVFVAVFFSPAFAEEQYVLAGRWNSAGISRGKFSSPEAVAVDRFENVYVADTGNARIVKLDADGNYVTEWGKFGPNEGQFRAPSGIAVDGVGNVYVSDSGDDRVQKFTSYGEYIGEGEIECSAIAVGPEGNIFLVTGNQIRQYSPSGVLLSDWRNALNAPNAIAVDADKIVCVVTGSIVTEAMVRKFTAEGELIDEWGTTGQGSPGSFRSPAGIAVDASGDIYVADTRNHRIQKFTSDGEFLTEWNWRGTGIWKLRYKPAGIAVDTSGHVYVISGDFLLKFRLSGQEDD